MSKPKSRERGKPKGPTKKKPKEGKTAILAEFRDFKRMFHRWSDGIKLDWGDKVGFTPGAEYRFILPSEMVNFVVSLVKRSHTGHDPETLDTAEDAEATQKRSLEEAAELRKAIDNGVQERLDSEPEAVPDERGVMDKRTIHEDPEEIV